MIRRWLSLAAALTLAASVSSAQAQAFSGRAYRIDETQVVTLEGNVHPLARAEFDLGVVDSDLPLDRMLLALKPSPAKQAALDSLVEEQQNPASGLYHRWLTPAEFGAEFGADESDLALVTAWLDAHGFAIREIAAGRRLVEFSGTAGEVYDAFHTEIRRYQIGSELHIANAQDPQIPVALAGAVRGVVSLHDFRRGSEIATRTAPDARAADGLRALYTAGSTHYLFPADFAAIYDLSPVYDASITGSGISIAIAARSRINLTDVATFRSFAGLGANNPVVILDGADPGLVAGDQDESTLDVEWSGAVATAAAVNLVVAGSTATTDGVDLAAAYIVNHAAASVVSVSYGSCEQEMGAAELAFYNDLWEQAAAQGMSVFVASGDAGAAGCSKGTDSVGSAAAVNGLCSSPYATCVGGTEFDEGTNAAEYWVAANSAGYGSALGYVPEVAWNESALNSGTGLWATGGGVSVMYSQPDWQASASGAGSTNGMRGVPDVALAAANHDGYFMVENGAHWIVSGTSVAAPSFAGLMALVIEKQLGAVQGSANPRLYALSSVESSPFHATPGGNNSVPDVNGFAASGATYNLATGLGSVDGALLMNDWNEKTEPVLIIRPPKSCVQFGSISVRCKPPSRTPILWRMSRSAE